MHNLWCSSSPDQQTAASCFSWTFVEHYDFRAIFLLPYHKVLHVRVVVFLATSKAKLFSQVFKVDIGKYFSIKIAQLTFLPQCRFLIWC